MSYLNRLKLRSAAVLLFAMLAALAVSSWFSLQAFQLALAPEVEQKAATLGRMLTELLDDALAHDMTLTELVGVNELFRDAQKENPEIGLFAITGDDGVPLYHLGVLDEETLAFMRGKEYMVPVGGDPAVMPAHRRVSAHFLVSLPIVTAGAVRGYLHVGADVSFVQRVLQENLLDVLVVLVVAFFIAIEIFYFFAGRSAATQIGSLMYTVQSASTGNFDRRLTAAALTTLGPLALAVNNSLERVNGAYERLLQTLREACQHRRQRDAAGLRQILHAMRTLRKRYRFGPGAMEDAASQLDLVRAPLFLFLFAEDLSRSFIPVYAAQLFAPIPGVSANFMLGLPIMLFMLIVALSQPIVGGWSERVGRRRALLAGAMLGTLAHLASAFAFSLYDLLLWRSLAGIAWGVVFVAGQGFVLDHTDNKTRTRGIAFFIGVIMVSSACGPSIGGILADGIGYRATLLVSASMTAVAAWLTWGRLADDRNPHAAARLPGIANFSRLLKNRKFVVFLLSAAMPAKIILIAYCFYLIPLYMPDLGYTAAMAGRLIMLYAVMMVVGVPLAARWSGQASHHWLFVAAGLCLSGVAGVIPFILPDIYGMVVMVLLLGAAQSLSIAPQTAMVGLICRAEIVSLGEGSVMGIYRLVERIGNALGPLVAALMLEMFGFGWAFGGVGLMMLVCAAVFVLIFRGAELNTSSPSHAVGV